MTEQNDVNFPRRISVHQLMTFWPLVLMLVGVIVAGANADSTLADHSVRLAKVEVTVEAMREKMASIEQQTADTEATTHRIEARMDTYGKQ